MNELTLGHDENTIMCGGCQTKFKENILMTMDFGRYSYTLIEYNRTLTEPFQNIKTMYYG